MTSVVVGAAARARGYSAAFAHPRPFGRGTAQLVGVAAALSLLAVLGVVEARTPPNITFGGFLLLVVLASTWLFSAPASVLVTIAALSVPVIAWRVGGDDIVASEVEILAVLFLGVTVHVAVHAIEDYASLLAQRNDELLGVNASLESFTADAAHEFRAPLAVVLSEVDLALTSGDSVAGYRRHLEMIRSEVVAMRGSITSLLTLARADAGSLQAAFRPTDLVDLLELLLARWRPLFDAKGVALLGRFPDAGELTCDPDLFTRVLDNLVDNALRVVPRDGQVTLDARRDGADWLLAVTDTGPGIEPDAIAPLLQGSSRAASGRSRGRGGSGFGLALCAAIVRAHRGSITVASSTAGTTFAVRVPGPPE